MGMFRDLLIKVFTTYFSLLPVPKSFQEIAKDPRKYIIVTRFQSLLFEALLRSFFRRSGNKNSELSPVHVKHLQKKNGLAYCALLDVAHLDPSLLQGYEFVTMNVIRGRGPMRSTPRYSQNIFDFCALLCVPLLRGGFLTILFGDSITNDYSARKLHRQLQLDFYQNLKVVRGSPFQPFQTQMKTVVGGSEFEREIEQLAAKHEESPKMLVKEARGTFCRMAANPRAWCFIPAIWVARFLMRRLFDGISATNLDNFKQASRAHPVVLIPLHRSHLDYILLGAVLYESNLNPPLVAAGINLSFWPAGPIIRSLGGYFVKRNARHDRMHHVLLRRYVSYLFKRGHLQEFFIEGGRSRSGRMRQPKLGLLRIFVEAYQKGVRKDIQFVPVAITYENVIEDRVYGDENTGQAKQKENLWALLKARKILQQNYGEVVLHFGEPILLSEFSKTLSGDAEPDSEHSKAEVLRLALHLTRKIRSYTSVNLTGLSFTVLMNAPKYGTPVSQFSKSIENLVHVTEIMKEIDPDIAPPTQSLQNFLRSDDSFMRFVKSGLIQRSSFLDEEILYIEGRHRYTGHFYKNATIHLFVPISFLAISNIIDSEINDDSLKRLYKIFSYDYILEPSESFFQQIDKLKELLLTRGILTEQEGKLTFAHQEPGIFMPELMLPSIQALLWVLTHVKHYSQDSAHHISEKQLLELMQQHAQAGKYEDFLSCTEATSQSMLLNSLTSLRKRGIIQVRDSLQRGTMLTYSSESEHEYNFLMKMNQKIREWQLTKSPL